MIKEKNKNDFSSDILNWYYKNNYEFPWRNNSDPYAIWLSEVMLQQTQTATVIPFYNRWLAKLPDIQSVAESHIDIILKMWEGLGYYNRARNFHTACKIIIKKHNGKMPHDLSTFSTLPGVGPYIASAVMSIAFNVPVPAIGGNAVRVSSRINSVNIPFPKSKQIINSYLENLIDVEHPGDFNQAIMDLGRELCTPTHPSCQTCPVQNYCSSFVDNTVDKYPIRLKKQPAPNLKVAVGIIWKNNKILISRRKNGGFLGGLWEFPGGKIKQGESGSECVVRELLEELNVLVHPISHIKNVRHSYTHFSITLEAYKCQYKSGEIKAVGCADFRWVHPQEMKQLAFPRASHKLFDSIEGFVSI